MQNMSINALFEIMRSIFFNLQEDEALQQLMAQWGFPPERVQEGHTLLLNAQQLHAQKDERYHNWLNLSRQVQADRDAALQVFAEHVQVARLAFREQPPLLKQLKISRIQKKKVWEWIPQAHRFYTLALANSSLMKKRGVKPEELEQAKAGIEALLALKDRSLRKKGDAESATQERNRILEALRVWHVEFRAAARLALKDTPQMLEAFGMQTPS